MRPETDKTELDDSNLLQTRVSRLYSLLESQEASIDELKKNYAALQGHLFHVETEEPYPTEFVKGLLSEGGARGARWTMDCAREASGITDFSPSLSPHECYYRLYAPVPGRYLGSWPPSIGPTLDVSKWFSGQTEDAGERALQHSPTPRLRRDVFRQVVIGGSAAGSILGALGCLGVILTKVFVLLGPALLATLASLLILGINLVSPNEDDEA